MAKTLKLQVTFPMTIVFNTETVTDLEAAREEAREALVKGDPAKGAQMAFLKLFASDMSTEALLETLMRKGIRELLRKELTSELNNAETGVRVGDIKVAFKVPMVPRSCDGCIATSCDRDELLTNSGCTLKETGVRPALSSRWTKTV